MKRERALAARRVMTALLVGAAGTCSRRPTRPESSALLVGAAADFGRALCCAARRWIWAAGDCKTDLRLTHLLLHWPPPRPCSHRRGALVSSSLGHSAGACAWLLPPGMPPSCASATPPDPPLPLAHATPRRLWCRSVSEWGHGERAVAAGRWLGVQRSGSGLLGSRPLLPLGACLNPPIRRLLQRTADFRPSYLQLAELRDEFPGVGWMCSSAPRATARRSSAAGWQPGALLPAGRAEHAVGGMQPAAGCADGRAKHAVPAPLLCSPGACDRGHRHRHCRHRHRHRRCGACRCCRLFHSTPPRESRRSAAACRAPNRCLAHLPPAAALRLRAPALLHGSFNRPNIGLAVRHKELLGDGSREAVLQAR